MSASPNGASAQSGSSSTDPQNPASQNQGSDAAGRSESSAVFSPDQGQVSETVDWIREAFRPSVRQEKPGSQEPVKSDQKESEDQAGKAGEGTGEGSEPDKPFRVFRSEAEFDRAIQSETDRREARRRNEEARKQERELRDKDPYEYAKLMREREEEESANKDVNQKAVDFATEQVNDYDRKVLDPLLLSIKDEATRQKIVDSAPAAMEGREYIAAQAIEAIRKQALDEARSRLETDESFIKQILVKYGGQRAEPDVVSAVGTAPRRAINQDDAMNDYLRGRGRI